MKPILSTLALAASLSTVSLMAQDAPPPAAPPAPPGTPPLLPAPEAAPAEVPDGFKSEKERQSYALGTHFGSREKSNASMSGNPMPDTAEMLAGLKDVLSGSKSMDYAIGTQLGINIRRLEVDIDPEVFAMAVREVMSNQPSKLNTQQQQQVIQRISAEFNEKTAAKRKAEGAKALQAAEEFMATNAKVEGVKQTPGGLQYHIEKEGEGKSPTIDDIATMTLKGTLADGTVFEKSPDASPSRKPVKGLPKGLQEGLAMLKTGGKAKFWLPPAIGYGENGRPPLVKGNAVLTYEVELLGVEPMPKQPVTGPGGVSPARQPVTAVTPPITVEIPPKPSEKPAEPPKGPNTPKPPAPAPAAPPPATAPGTPEKK